jgi:rhodanese-related sulfurtransferase
MLNLLIRATVFLLVFACYAAQAQSSITQQELLVNQMSSSAYVIIDVRSKEEYDEGHIKGAINIPFNMIEMHKTFIDSLGSTPAVVYCRSGRRAGIFINTLAPKGFNLLHLQGDMNAWQSADLPVVK